MLDKKMLAWRLTQWGQPASFQEVDVPRPGPGELLVKVGGNGLCHSDGEMTHLDPRPGWNMPFTLGHEVGGWIAATGAGVTSVREGDPVLLSTTSSDGTCLQCLKGHDNNCVRAEAGRGFGRDGGLAAYVIVQSARDAIVIDGLDPLQTAPLVDAGTTSYHGVKRVLGKLVPGSTVLVIGAGGLGSYAVQYLRLLSAARIVVIDRSPGRLRYAQDLGAHDVLEGCTEVTRALIRDMTGGHGVQAVLDFVGTDETIAFGLSLAAWMSSFALIGAGNGTITTPLFHSLPRDGELFCFQGGTLAETREVLDLARSGVLRLDVEIFPFSQTAKAYEQMYAGQLRGRAVVCPNSWE